MNCFKGKNEKLNIEKEIRHTLYFMENNCPSDVDLGDGDCDTKNCMECWVEALDIDKDTILLKEPIESIESVNGDKVGSVDQYHTKEYLTKADGLSREMFMEIGIACTISYCLEALFGKGVVVDSITIENIIIILGAGASIGSLVMACINFGQAIFNLGVGIKEYIRFKLKK